MSKSARSAAPRGISAGDITHVLFKHKWKIILVTLFGWSAAVAYYLVAPPAYTSMAKLMVRYVVDHSALDHDTAASTASRAGEAVILSEMEILSSWDLCEKVATVPGMERILPKSNGPVKPGEVASMIADGMTMKAVPNSNVIQVHFKHQNAEMSQKVLDELIRQYFIKHLDVHRSKEAAKYVTEKVEQSRTKLRGAEEDVTKLKAENGILTLPDSFRTLSNEVARAETDLSYSETALAEQRARVAALKRYAGEIAARQAEAPSLGAPEKREEVRTAQAPSPADIKAAHSDEARPAESTGPKASMMEIAQYQSTLNKLLELRSAEVNLTEKWAPDSQKMQLHKAQIAKLESERQDLVKRHPELVATVHTGSDSAGSRIDLLAEKAQLDALEAKSATLREEVIQARKKVSDLTLLAPKIAEKERSAAIEEANYRYMGSSLERAQIDEALDSNKIPNISIVQEATPPVLDTKRRNQIIAGIAVAFPVLSVASVLLFGLVLNRTVKRAQELESRLGLPLVLSIPYFPRRRAMRLQGGNGKKLLGGGKTPPPPWEKGHFVQPYAESIRDRLHTYFETQGITQRPKLIGISGFSTGAGASTLATGLAAALSATDGNKVLLIDMNEAGGASHAFLAGKPAAASAAKSSGADEPDDLNPEDNLHLTTVTEGRTTGLSEFRRMMGELKSGDSDYLVFDMPPISEISPSATMAGLMDHMLVVVESETTVIEQVKHGYRDLLAAHAVVSVIFNKARSYGPQALVGV